MKSFMFILCLLAFPAQAQPCMPYVNTPGWVWSNPEFAVTKNGAWYRWTCWSTVSGVGDRRITYVATVPEFSKIGARVATILNAADPLKSLQTLPKRVTVLPLSDPSLAAIVSDIPK